MVAEPAPRMQASAGDAWKAGAVMFAGVIMIIAGVFEALAGIAAVVRRAFYVSAPHNLFRFDVLTWGWVHLVLGVLVALAGMSVLAGTSWGRVVGIVLAGASAIANFLFIPYYPIWTLLIIALDVFVIFALATYRSGPSAVDG
jgi:hypothetical protein